MTYGVRLPKDDAARVSLLIVCVLAAWNAIAQTSDDPTALTGSSIAAATLAPRGLPPRLIECEGNGLCNGAWTFNGANGDAIWFTKSPTRAKLTLVKSDPEELVIRRSDLSDGNYAVYHGRRDGDAYSGVVVWSKPDHPGYSSGHWSATIPQVTCEPSADLSSADALRISQTALMFDMKREAFDCSVAAAQAGDALAQTIVGLTYYQGRTRQVPQDYGKAIFWLKKAASQGVFAAQQTLSDMYALGEGADKNPELAKFYGDKAAAQKQEAIHEKERQEDRADRAADRAAYVLGQAFGSFLFVF